MYKVHYGHSVISWAVEFVIT